MGVARFPKIPGVCSDPHRNQMQGSPRTPGRGNAAKSAKKQRRGLRKQGTRRCFLRSPGKRGCVLQANAAPFHSGRFSDHTVSENEKGPQLQPSSRRSPFLICFTAVSPYSKPLGRRRRWPVPTWRNRPPPGSPGQLPKPPRTRRRPCTPAEGPRWRA